MSLQTQIDFDKPYMERHAVRLGGNCKKILAYWQRNNLPLSESACRTHLNVANLVQRVCDMKKQGIVILSRWDSTKTFKLYYLGCACAEPRKSTLGCWIHDEKLKIK